MPAARGLAGENLWAGSASRLQFIDRVLAAVDHETDRALAKSAELLLFEILHEKSLPLSVASLASEVPHAAHRERLRHKAVAGLFGPEPPAGSVVARLDDAAAWLLARL